MLCLEIVSSSLGQAWEKGRALEMHRYPLPSPVMLHSVCMAFGCRRHRLTFLPSISGAIVTKVYWTPVFSTWGHWLMCNTFLLHPKLDTCNYHVYNTMFVNKFVKSLHLLHLCHFNVLHNGLTMWGKFHLQLCSDWVGFQPWNKLNSDLPL